MMWGGGRDGRGRVWGRRGEGYAASCVPTYFGNDIITPRNFKLDWLERQFLKTGEDGEPGEQGPKGRQGTKGKIR